MATNDVLTLLIILVLYVFICGAPLFTIMLAGTALGTVFSARGFEINFDGAINKMFRISSRDEIEVLSTIPLFIAAGYILAEARTADRLVRFANAMLGWMPGGLAIVTIGTCALFTVFTGASGVTIIALGGVLMPALVRNGYPEKFSMGLIAGTGSVGLLFPPALPLFIYGTVYGLTGLDKETWATERFLFAGVVPGMVLIGMLSAVAIFVAVRKKLPRQKFAVSELAVSFLIALPELFIPFGVILGLATGFALPDIAALTVVYVLVLELGIFRILERVVPRPMAHTFRTIKFGQLWGISVEAIAMIGAIFAIIFASTAFTDFMVNAEVPRKLVIFTQEHVSSKIVFLLAINVILLIVGTVMDIFSAIVVVLPLIAPISRAYGIDPYHLGVIFLLNLEVGYLHPPVGLNLFLTSVKFQKPITDVMWATIPFLITMIVALLVITYVPALTWVPPPERVAPVNNLVEMVDNGVEESKVSIPEIVLVDAAGSPLIKDAKNQLDEVELKLRDPKIADRDKAALKTREAELKRVVRRLVDCRAKPAAAAPATDGAEAKPESPEDRDRKIQSCQKLFFDVTNCRPHPARSTPDELACANKAIATWTVERLNEDDPINAIVIVDKVALVDETNAPLTLEEEVMGPDGRPQKDKDDNTITKTIAIVGPDGKSPVTRTLAWCDELEFSADRETCHKLFVAASNCKINFEPADASCVEAKCPAKPGDPAPSAGSAGSAGSGTAVAPANDGCKQAAAAECAKQPIAACVLAAAKEWASDSHSVALRPKLKGSGSAVVNDDEGSDLGLSLKGGLIGLAIVVSTQFLMRRRRRDVKAA